MLSLAGPDRDATSAGRAPRPTAAGSEVARLAAAAADYAEGARAPATRRAYDSSWRGFRAWCDGHGAQALPAAPAVVALFLVDRAQHGARVSSLSRALAAIGAAHRDGGFSPPESPGLTATWAGIRREHARRPKRAAALVTADLRKVCQRLPADRAGTRDRALLLVGFAGALRRSELVALTLGDGPGHRVDFIAGGLRISLAATKTDQEGRGDVIGIPTGKTKLCAVAALRAWLDAAGIAAGPVFRGVDRHGRVSPRGLSDRAVADVIKRAVVRAGLNPLLFSGHSLRAGFVTAAAAAGVATDRIMRQTRHRDAKTVAVYVREASLFEANAAAKVGL